MTSRTLRIVTKIYAGTEGHVLAADIGTQNYIKNRPITKLVILT